jgi:hypothetical protein
LYPHENGNAQMLPEPVAPPVVPRPRDKVLSLADLWLRCYALGTTNTPEELAAFLRGEIRPTRHEYNLVAVALNEYLVDIGAGASVPYMEHTELAGQAAPLCARWRRPVDLARW